jgi:hypothetical protein
VTLRGEPTWGGVAAPATGPAQAPTATSNVPARASTEPAGGGSRPSTEDLESDVYVARDVHGDARAELRRMLAQARSRLSEATYRRALELARDSVLLSVEECVQGAQAMEWNPLPRPEFSLATIEAAVAEQERNEQSRRAG